jgi:hypothetical protein
VLLAAGGALALGWTVARGDAAAAVERERARAAEEELLETKDLVVAHQVAREVVEADRDRLAGRIPELEAGLAHLQAAAPRSRVVSVEEMSTGPIKVTAPRPPDPPDAPPIVTALAVSDQVKLRVGRVGVETEKGNLVLIAAAQAVRIYPPPEEVLASGELRGRSDVAAQPRCESGGAPWWSLAAACAVCGGAAATAVAVRR